MKILHSLSTPTAPRLLIVDVDDTNRCTVRPREAMLTSFVY